MLSHAPDGPTLVPSSNSEVRNDVLYLMFVNSRPKSLNEIWPSGLSNIGIAKPCLGESVVSARAIVFTALLS